MRAALVLAGGRGRRLGGVDKALIEVAGVTMLDRVLAAARPHCDDIVVVGPTRATSIDRVQFTIEPDPGGGPVPAVGAGLAVLPGGTDQALLLAVDLPLLRPDHVAALFSELPGADAVAAVDDRGRPNPILAAYRADVLRATIKGLGPGVAAAQLLPPATVVVDLGEAGTLNVNSPHDLARARRLARPAP